MAEEIRVGNYIVLRDRLYTRTDEWAKREDGVVVVGITDYAQKKLRDIVGVELPEPGSRVKAGEAVGSIESVKAAADIYAPVSGEVVEVNERLYDEPELVNKDPYGEGWMFKIRISDESELEKLLTPEQYAEKIRREEEGH
ncbi:glycine cleavage system protein H [Pyrodictium occultum]|uniref:Probable glycine cleavage system H protein n=1 Tax=Pyrodictium occultum TaxID=2309 RepID=A0A0V8RVK4_PYROC|nr:glycine cleavage system protein GcvH [Pyrodictium occultum]KSW12079.1 glycine cleavage system protein H [Pyrodictium occultum]